MLTQHLVPGICGTPSDRELPNTWSQLCDVQIAAVQSHINEPQLLKSVPGLRQLHGLVIFSHIERIWTCLAEPRQIKPSQRFAEAQYIVCEDLLKKQYLAFGQSAFSVRTKDS